MPIPALPLLHRQAQAIRVEAEQMFLRQERYLK